MGSRRSYSTLIGGFWLLCWSIHATAQTFSPPNFCTAGNTTSCGSSFPSTVCCATGYSCHTVPMVEYAVFCCASGDNCTSIAPISCSSSTTAPPANRGNNSYVLSPFPVASCGSLCCPSGFACQNGACVLEQSTNGSATTSSASTSSSSASTLVTSSSTSQNATATANPVSTSQAAATVFITQNSTSNNAGTIAGAVVGGVAGLAILVGGAVYLLTRRRRQSAAATSDSGDMDKSEKHPDDLLKRDMAEMAAQGPSEIDSGSVYEMHQENQLLDPETKAVADSQRRQRLSRMFELGASRRSEVHELP